MRYHFLILATLLMCLQGCAEFVSSPPNNRTLTGTVKDSHNHHFPLPFCDFASSDNSKSDSKAAPCVTRPNELLAAGGDGAVCYSRIWNSSELLWNPVTRQTKESGKSGICESNGETISNTVYPLSSHQQLLEQVERGLLNDMGTAKLPQLGISLAGGGSKAASFGMGVLAGMADNALLEKTDLISTVSGGSYAAYFLYTHTVLPPLWENTNPIASLDELFTDCMNAPWDREPGQKTDLKPGEKEAMLTGSALEKYKKYKCDYLRPNPDDTLNVARPVKLPEEPKDKPKDKPKEKLTPPPELSNKFQTFVGCSSDLFQAGICNGSENELLPTGLSWKSMPALVVTIPVAILANTVFDTGVRISTSATMYQNGIGVGFGAIPDARFEFPTQKNPGMRIDCVDPTPAAPGQRSDPANFPPAFAPDARHLAYGCSVQAMEKGGGDLQFHHIKTHLMQQGAKPKPTRLPYWIINASSPKHRSLSTVVAGEDFDLRDVFEMTVASHGSDRYGHVSTDMGLHGMTVLNAVESSAAFFDSNGTALPQPIRGATSLVQRILNFEWGIDIGNYNVSHARTALHRGLPFPLYWIDGWFETSSKKILKQEYARTHLRTHLDMQASLPPEQTVSGKATLEALRDRHRSSMIRLIDGGNAENLGLYSLIRRKVQNIVVADSSFDGDGKFDDLCRLKRNLQLEGKDIILPGLDDFERFCNAGPMRYPNTEDNHHAPDDRNHCQSLYDNGPCRADKYGYQIHSWNFDYPVLLGCVRELDQATGTYPTDCKANEGKPIQRLFVIKPAINLPNYLRVLDKSKREYPQQLGVDKLKDCWAASEVEKSSRTSTIMKSIGTDMKGNLACDTAIYLLQRDYAGADRDGCPEFPQNGTATMAINSTPNRYAAYRELARQYTWFAAQLIQKIIGDGQVGKANVQGQSGIEQFNELIKQQSISPMKPSLISSDYGMQGHHYHCKMMRAASSNVQ